MPLSLLLSPLFGSLYLVGAVVVGFFGRRRVFGFWGFFLLSLFATPIVIGLLLILAAPSPDARERERKRWLNMNGIR